MTLPPAEADGEQPLQIDTLPADLAPLFLERLTFTNLLALRLVCSRLNAMAYAVTKVTLNRRGHLYIPLLRKFSAVQSLTLEGFEQSWIPRLACVLGVFPRLVKLCLRKSRSGGGGPVPQQMLTDGVMLGVVGALQAGACPLLNNLNLDERLPEEMALQLATVMPPNGGLLFATIQAHEAVVRAMLSRGAHLEAELDEGETALLVAAYHACPAITKLLLQQRAEVNTRRQDGATPLIMAANRGNAETALVLLGAKADVGATMNDGVSPLQRAADKGHAAVVTLLLRAGARVDHRTSNGISALWMAAKAGRAEVVSLLLEAKAEVDALLSDGGSRGTVERWPSWRRHVWPPSISSWGRTRRRRLKARGPPSAFVKRGTSPQVPPSHPASPWPRARTIRCAFDRHAQARRCSRRRTRGTRRSCSGCSRTAPRSTLTAATG